MAKRSERMQRLLRNKAEGWSFDYDLVRERTSWMVSLAAMVP
jgi:neutral trehalase